MRGTIPPASQVCTHRGWGLSIPVVTTYTSFATKASSKHAQLLSSSYRQGRRVGLTLKTRGIARSDGDRRAALNRVLVHRWYACATAPHLPAPHHLAARLGHAGGDLEGSRGQAETAL